MDVYYHFQQRKKKVNYSPLISDLTQGYTSIENEPEEMKMLTVALAITRMVLCRQGHIFCLTSESTTIIKSSFGCNSSNKHFMSPLIQYPIQCLWSSSRLYILMTSEMSLASGLWRFVHANKHWLNFTMKQQHYILNDPVICLITVSFPPLNSFTWDTGLTYNIFCQTQSPVNYVYMQLICSSNLLPLATFQGFRIWEGVVSI